MDIKQIKEKVENAMEDKQEFADLCFNLVPQLIEEIETLNKRYELLSGYYHNTEVLSRELKSEMLKQTRLHI